MLKTQENNTEHALENQEINKSQSTQLAKTDTEADINSSERRDSLYIPTPLEFEEHLFYASQQLMAPFCFTFRIYKRKRLSSRSTLSRISPQLKEEIITMGDMNFFPVIIIFTYYDLHHHLVHLKFEKSGGESIPREIFKIIAYMLPYHPYISKITFNGGIAAFSIHEMKSFQRTLPALTEICLDNSYVPEGNYAILLDPHSQLINLSLAHCQIDDEVVRRIFEKLGKLRIINLASNIITDKGATYISQTLRRNRSLIYLNLSANKFLTDEGISGILNMLKMFPLTSAELLARKKEHFLHLTRNSEMQRIKSPIKDKSDPRTLPNSSTLVFEHIFSKKNTTHIDGLTYCNGNNILSCLILSHCNFGIITLNKLIQVLDHQKKQKSKPKGLLHLNIEGNFLPTLDKELYYLEDMLQEQLMRTINEQNRVEKENVPTVTTAVKKRVKI